ncbi:MAG: TM0106 family RecB-like putative nuclease [Planctomycetes bacterium]|nr:TM0106 family RecB-like putative nuclease [Planctomycetota bacterium]
MTHELPRIDLAGSGLALTRHLVTGTHLHQFYGCSHATFLEFTRDRALKAPHTPAVEKLLERGRDYEAEVVRHLEIVEPSYEPRDWVSGRDHTLELMRAGHPWIFQAVLYDPPYLGIADLLRRIEVPSRLGKHAYEVLDVKSSRKARLEQMLQVAFYSLLLAKEQGHVPEEGALILAEQREERFRIDDVQWTLLDVLDELGELLTGERSSTPHRNPTCDGCPWRTTCLPDMEESEHVSLLPSMSRSRVQRLRRHGIATLRDLETSEPEVLSKQRVLSRQALENLVFDARAFRRGELTWRTGVHPPRLMWPLTFVQVERDGFRDDGSCVLAWTTLHEDLERQHRCFLLRDDEDERAALESWLERLGQGDAPRLVIYGSHVAKRLAERLRHFGLDVPDVLNDALDLRGLVQEHLSVPVAGDSLYAIGQHLSTHAFVEGGPAPALWWETYRQEDDASFRDLVTDHIERNAETAHALLRLLHEGPGGAS